MWSAHCTPTHSSDAFVACCWGHCKRFVMSPIGPVYSDCSTEEWGMLWYLKLRVHLASGLATVHYATAIRTTSCLTIRFNCFPLYCINWTSKGKFVLWHPFHCEILCVGTYVHVLMLTVLVVPLLGPVSALASSNGLYCSRCPFILFTCEGNFRRIDDVGGLLVYCVPNKHTTCCITRWKDYFFCIVVLSLCVLPGPNLNIAPVFACLRRVSSSGNRLVYLSLRLATALSCHTPCDGSSASSYKQWSFLRRQSPATSAQPIDSSRCRRLQSTSTLQKFGSLPV